MLKLELSTRVVVLVALGILVLWLFVQLWGVVLLLISALIFMAALNPYVSWLVSHGWPRRVAVVALLVLISAAIGGMLVLVVPAMIDEFSHLRHDLPADAREIERLLSHVGVEVDLEGPARDINWDKLVSGRAAVSYGTEALLTLVSVFTVAVLTVYLLIDAPRLEAFLFQFVPPGREPEVVQVLGALNRVVGGYVRGQFITSGIIAVYTLVVLLALGVPNAVAFSVLAAFADLLPLIGPFLSIVPGTSAALRESPGQAVAVAALLLLYQQFEDRFLVPRVYGRTLNLPPLIVLVAVLAGGELLGVTGILLALPTAAAGRVGLDYWLDRRRSTVAQPIPTDEPLAPDANAPRARRPQEEPR